MGLFVMVGALVEVGVIGQHRRARSPTPSATDYLLAGIGAALGLRRAVRDRRQHPLRRHHDPDRRRTWSTPAAAPRRPTSLWWALALGADLGGNATAVGASANVVIIGIAARNGHPITFWHFTKYGLVVAVVTIAVAWAYLWLRYFAFA